MYYENYILINTDTPNFEEIKKKYFDNEGNKVVLLDDNYSIQSPFEYFTPVMGIDPDGHFTILGLLIGIGLSLTFEFLEDLLDGNGLDHSFKEYLGAGISGAFGALSGNGLMRGVFSLTGGLIDAWLTGDLEKNGIGKTLLSIGISFVVGEAAHGLSNYVSNKIQIGKLTSDPHANQSLLKKLGIKHGLNKNGRSISSFVNSIKENTWTSKMLFESFSIGVTSNTASMIMGLI